MLRCYLAIFAFLEPCPDFEKAVVNLVAGHSVPHPANIWIMQSKRLATLARSSCCWASSLPIFTAAKWSLTKIMTVYIMRSKCIAGNARIADMSSDVNTRKILSTVSENSLNTGPWFLTPCKACSSETGSISGLMLEYGVHMATSLIYSHEK